MTTTKSVADEVLAAFTAYEHALCRNDIDAMNGYFWDSEDVVRFGLADEQWGAEQLHRWRAGAPAVPAGRMLTDTAVATLGEDTAIVTTLFGYPGESARGRQSQTWYRFAEGWRIVNAHVSRR